MGLELEVEAEVVAEAERVGCCFLRLWLNLRSFLFQRGSAGGLAGASVGASVGTSVDGASVVSTGHHLQTNRNRLEHGESFHPKSAIFPVTPVATQLPSPLGALEKPS